MSLALPFVSSSPSPRIIINFSTPTPQHMFSSSHMSCPSTFPNPTSTHLTIYFPLTIFLVKHLFLLPMFIPIVLIHDPNFLLILLCPFSMGAFDIFNGGVEKSNGGIERGHWKNPVGVLCRVNGGIDQGQWGHGERVNGGIEKDQWGLWSRSMGVLKRVNALVRVNGGIEKGQVRQGLGCGSDRGVAVGQTGGCLTGL